MKSLLVKFFIFCVIPNFLGFTPLSLAQRKGDKRGQANNDRHKKGDRKGDRQIIYSQLRYLKNFEYLEHSCFQKSL